jgi:ribonuclease E
MLDNEPTGVSGEQPDQTSDTQDAATTAATNEGEAPQRQRRRAASRPAGPPVPPPAGSEATASDDAAAEAESKPKRARKTAAKKVAAPEPAEPAAETAEAGDAPAAKKTTRTRARKKAAEAEPVEASQAQDSGAEQAQDAGTEESGATTTGARTRTRRRATSAGTATEQATGTEASEASTGQSASAEQADSGRSTAKRGARAAASRGDVERGDTDREQASAAETTTGQADTATSATGTPRTRTRRRATSAGTAAEQASAEASAAQDTAAGQQGTRADSAAAVRGVDSETASDQSADTSSRPGLTSPFTNPFAAPQLPAKGAKAAKKTAQAQESPAEQPAKADSKPDTKPDTKLDAKADTPAAPESELEPESDSDAKPKRTRRRAASAPAGPPRAQEAAESQQDKQDKQDKPDTSEKQDRQGRQDKQSRQPRQDRQDKTARGRAARDKAPQPAAQDAATAAAEPVDLDSLSPAERARAIIAARAAAPAAGVLFQAPDLTTAAAQKAAVKAAKADATEAEAEAEPEAEAEEEPAPARRTRTRNRNRNRAEQAESTPESAEAEAEDEDDEDDEGTGSSSRRRRRRRRRAGGESIEPGPDDPPNTVVKVRESRVRSRGDRKGGTAPDDDVQGVRGSTRLEAKKQRRREGRDTGRRRAPLITEAEFLARRESVERVMVVRQSGDRTQIGVLEDGVLVEHYVNRAQSASYVGNVYLGKVQNVLPSMEAAFVDIGKGRNAVLYAGEVNFDAAGITGHAKRIESVLKSGQAVLTQVTKDPIGHKGARLTSQISLPGRYLVYVPEGTMTGISRKLPENERNRLKAILKAVVPENAGVIVRTAAEGATEDELRRDVERLSAQWEEIQRKAASSASSAPTLLYGEPDLTVRVVRDIFNEDFIKLIVSGDQAWDTIREYVGGVAPDLAPRLERWTSEQDVFAVHRVDEQLAKGLDRKVWLPSGGSLVIDRTEAMVVIDVNTGKFTGSGGNLEETVTRNNIEAAEEIVRQLRLRDLGGIIVIDFIDMVLESNRDLVMRRLLECLGRDRTKHQVAEVTSLGLIQMTRKRVGQGLLEAFSETCDKCNGRGVLVHMEPVPVNHGHSHEDAERDGRGQQGRGGRQGGEARSEGGQNGADEEHEGGRGRRKRRKSHGHADRQQHFDPQYDLDGVPEEFQDFADGEQAAAGPVLVTNVTKVAADDADRDQDLDDDDADEDDATELSEHSDVEHIPSHAHVVAPVVTPGDVVAAEEADVTERLATGDAQAHTVYVPHAGGDVSVAEADKEETEAQGAGQAEPASVATLAAPAAEAAQEAPKRRGALRVRRAAKRPAGPPTAHS